MKEQLVIGQVGVTVARLEPATRDGCEGIRRLPVCDKRLESLKSVNSWSIHCQLFLSAANLYKRIAFLGICIKLQKCPV